MPITALYFGPAAWWGYRCYGRPKSPRWRREQGAAEQPAQPGWASTVPGVSHWGAGCTLSDIVAEFAEFAEFAVFGLGLALAG